MNDDFISQVQDQQKEAREQAQKEQEAARDVQIGLGISQAVTEEHEKTRKSIESDKKVEVKNFPKDYATKEDVAKLVDAVRALDKTTEQKEVDLSPIEAGLDVMATKIEMGIEAIPQAPEPYRVVSIDNLVDNTSHLLAIEAAIKSKDMTVNVEPPKVKVEAPKVDVKPPEVNVEVDTKEIAEKVGLLEGMFAQMLKTLEQIEYYVGVTAKRPIPVGSGGGLSTGTAAATDTTENILLETGDALLLETGDQILLE